MEFRLTFSTGLVWTPGNWTARHVPLIDDRFSIPRSIMSGKRKRVQRLMKLMGLEGLFPGGLSTIGGPRYSVREIPDTIAYSTSVLMLNCSTGRVRPVSPCRTPPRRADNPCDRPERRRERGGASMPPSLLLPRTSR